MKPGIGLPANVRREMLHHPLHPLFHPCLRLPQSFKSRSLHPLLHHLHLPLQSRGLFTSPLHLHWKWRSRRLHLRLRHWLPPSRYPRPVRQMRMFFPARPAFESPPPEDEDVPPRPAFTSPPPESELELAVPVPSVAPVKVSPPTPTAKRRNSGSPRPNPGRNDSPRVRSPSNSSSPLAASARSSSTAVPRGEDTPLNPHRTSLSRGSSAEAGAEAT